MRCDGRQIGRRLANLRQQLPGGPAVRRRAPVAANAGQIGLTLLQPAGPELQNRILQTRRLPHPLEKIPAFIIPGFRRKRRRNATRRKVAKVGLKSAGLAESHIASAEFKPVPAGRIHPRIRRFTANLIRPGAYRVIRMRRAFRPAVAHIVPHPVHKRNVTRLRRVAGRPRVGRAQIIQRQSPHLIPRVPIERIPPESRLRRIRRRPEGLQNNYRLRPGQTRRRRVFMRHKMRERQLRIPLTPARIRAVFQQRPNNVRMTKPRRHKQKRVPVSVHSIHIRPGRNQRRHRRRNRIRLQNLLVQPRIQPARHRTPVRANAPVVRRLPLHIKSETAEKRPLLHAARRPHPVPHSRAERMHRPPRRRALRRIPIANPQPVVRREMILQRAIFPAARNPIQRPPHRIHQRIHILAVAPTIRQNRHKRHRRRRIPPIQRIRNTVCGRQCGNPLRQTVPRHASPRPRPRPGRRQIGVLTPQQRTRRIGEKHIKRTHPRIRLRRHLQPQCHRTRRQKPVRGRRRKRRRIRQTIHRHRQTRVLVRMIFRPRRTFASPPRMRSPRHIAAAVPNAARLPLQPNRQPAAFAPPMRLAVLRIRPAKRPRKLPLAVQPRVGRAHVALKIMINGLNSASGIQMAAVVHIHLAETPVGAKIPPVRPPPVRAVIWLPPLRVRPVDVAEKPGTGRIESVSGVYLMPRGSVGIIQAVAPFAVLQPIQRTACRAVAGAAVDKLLAVPVLVYQIVVVEIGLRTAPDSGMSGLAIVRLAVKKSVGARHRPRALAVDRPNLHKIAPRVQGGDGHAENLRPHPPNGLGVVMDGVVAAIARIPSQILRGFAHIIDDFISQHPSAPAGVLRRRTPAENVRVGGLINLHRPH